MGVVGGAKVSVCPGFCRLGKLGDYRRARSMISMTQATIVRAKVITSKMPIIGTIEANKGKTPMVRVK